MQAVAAGPTRVNVYVDGYNLYFGLRESGWQRYYWLDIHKMSEGLLRGAQQLHDVKYFTARISGPVDRAKRQSTFLDALGTLPVVRIYEGHYLSKPVTCKACGVSYIRSEAKMTDVSIATEMLMDAFADRYDKAILVSADSDLVPPIRAVQDRMLNKQVIVAFPPRRQSAKLKQVADGFFFINEQLLRRSQLSDQIVTPGGQTLDRPANWR